MEQPFYGYRDRSGGIQLAAIRRAAKLWYIPQGKEWRYKTNALNAMLNNYDPKYLPVIKKYVRMNIVRFVIWRSGCLKRLKGKVSVNRKMGSDVAYRT